MWSGIYDAPVASARRVSLPTNEAGIWCDPDLVPVVPDTGYLFFFPDIFNMFQHVLILDLSVHSV